MANGVTCTGYACLPGPCAGMAACLLSSCPNRLKEKCSRRPRNRAAGRVTSVVALGEKRGKPAETCRLAGYGCGGIGSGRPLAAVPAGQDRPAGVDRRRLDGCRRAAACGILGSGLPKHAACCIRLTSILTSPKHPNARFFGFRSLILAREGRFGPLVLRWVRRNVLLFDRFLLFLART